MQKRRNKEKLKMTEIDYDFTNISENERETPIKCYVSECPDAPFRIASVPRSFTLPDGFVTARQLYFGKKVDVMEGMINTPFENPLLVEDAIQENVSSIQALSNEQLQELKDQGDRLVLTIAPLQDIEDTPVTSDETIAPIQEDASNETIVLSENIPDAEDISDVQTKQISGTLAMIETPPIQRHWKADRLIPGSIRRKQMKKVPSESSISYHSFELRRLFEEAGIYKRYP